MANTDQCRDIKELSIPAQTLLSLALTDIRKQGVNPLIVETYRSQERQNWLYAQGRTRDLKSPKITWTLNSIHTLKNAVDLIPQRNGQAIWNAKDKETLAIIKTMAEYGFEAGANWTKNVDSPHFQLAGISATQKEFSAYNTNKFVTKMIQKALNQKLKGKLATDGIWGKATTAAVNAFRKQEKYKYPNNGKLGAIALYDLSNYKLQHLQ